MYHPSNSTASMFITAPLCKVKIHPNIVFQTPPKHFSLIRSLMGFIRVSACAWWGNVSCIHPHLWGLSRAKQCRGRFSRQRCQMHRHPVYSSVKRGTRQSGHWIESECSESLSSWLPWVHCTWYGDLLCVM